MVEIFSLNLIILLFIITVYLIRNSDFLKSYKSAYLVIVLLSLAGSIFVVIESVQDIKAFLDRREWPVVAGKITSLDIVGIKTREPAIRFEYKIENKTYSVVTNLNTPFFGSSKSQEQTSRTIIAHYAVGDTVTVYFNPDNYEQAVLKVTPHLGTFMQFSFGIMITSITLGLLFQRLARGKKSI